MSAPWRVLVNSRAAAGKRRVRVCKYYTHQGRAGRAKVCWLSWLDVDICSVWVLSAGLFQARFPPPHTGSFNSGFLKGPASMSQSVVYVGIEGGFVSGTCKPLCPQICDAMTIGRLSPLTPLAHTEAHKRWVICRSLLTSGQGPIFDCVQLRV